MVSSSFPYGVRMNWNTLQLIFWPVMTSLISTLCQLNIEQFSARITSVFTESVLYRTCQLLPRNTVSTESWAIAILRVLSWLLLWPSHECTDTMNIVHDHKIHSRSALSWQSRWGSMWLPYALYGRWNANVADYSSSIFRMKQETLILVHEIMWIGKELVT